MASNTINRLRIGTIAAFLLVATGLSGLIYYNHVLKPKWLREEVTQYVDAQMVPAYTTNEQSIASGQFAIYHFIDSKKDNTEAFVEDIMDFRNAFGQLTQNPDEQRRIAHEKFEAAFFSSSDLAQMIEAAVQKHYQTIAESANKLSRSVSTDYPYNVTYQVGVKPDQIQISHEELVTYVKGLSDHEFYANIGRIGAGFVVDKIIQIAAPRAVSAVGGLLGAGASQAIQDPFAKILVFAGSLTAGFAVSWYLDHRAKVNMIKEINDGLDHLKTQLMHDVFVPLKSQSQKQIDHWHDELIPAILGYREAT